MKDGTATATCRRVPKGPRGSTKQMGRDQLIGWPNVAMRGRATMLLVLVDVESALKEALASGYLVQ